MLFTSPAVTAFVNCEYVRSFVDEPELASVLTRNAAAMSASTTHGTQRSDGDEPDGLSPLPPEPGLPFDRSGGRLVPPGRQPGGGVGGRPFGPGRPLASGSFPGRRSDGSDGRRLMELPELLGGDGTMLRPRACPDEPRAVLSGSLTSSAVAGHPWPVAVRSLL